MFLPPYCNCHHFSFHVRSLTLWTYIGRTIRQTVSAFSAPGTWSPWKLEGREDGALEVICSKIKELVKEQCKLSHTRPPRSPPRAALTSSSAALEEASRRLGSIAGASGQSALSLRLETIDKDSCISPALESEIKAPASTKGAVVTDSDCNELVRFLKGKGLSAIAPRFSEVMGIELVHHFGKLQAEDFDDPELSFLKRWQKQELIELVQGITAGSASLRDSSLDDNIRSAADTASEGDDTASESADDADSSVDAVLAKHPGNPEDFQTHMKGFITDLLEVMSLGAPDGATEFFLGT